MFLHPIGDIPKDKWKEMIEQSLEELAHDHYKKMNSQNSIYPTIWRENFVYYGALGLTQQRLYYYFKDMFLKYLFGDLEYQFDITTDHIHYNSGILMGTFTFAKGMKLKFGTI